jgi:hypothetical protein
VFRPSVAESDPKQFIHLLRFSVFRDTYLAVNSLGTQAFVRELRSYALTVHDGPRVLGCSRWKEQRTIVDWRGGSGCSR